MIWYDKLQYDIRLILIRYLIYNETVQNNTVSMSHKQQHEQISHPYLKTTRAHKESHTHRHTHIQRECQIIEAI
jgi:hypothetical protein